MRIKADGDTWRISMDERPAHPGVRTVVFHCETNGQKGWRVVEVPEDRFATEDALARVDEAELQELFDRSDAYDYVHDAHADPRHPVEEAPRSARDTEDRP